MRSKVMGLAAPCFATVLMVSLSATPATQSQTKNSTDDGMSQTEQDLFVEINQARAHPEVYASYLEKMKPFYSGKEYKPATGDGFTTQEGWSAVEDAVKFLRAAGPQHPLTKSNGLRLAALTHVKDQTATGATGHKGTDSTFIEERVKPFGVWDGGIGENLAYGNQSARERVLTWLIDDGFASRGHRNRLMSVHYRVVGVSCGPHPEFGSMCVVTLAGGFTELKVMKPVVMAPARANTEVNANTGTNTQTAKTMSPTSRKTTKRRSH